MTRMPRIAIAALAAAVTVLAIGMPAGTTAASLTATGSATASAGVGNWCSVPNPAVSKNVYKLSDFTAIDAPETAGGSTPVRMLVLPVVNDGSFDPVEPLPAQVAAVTDQLGVRLWSCTPFMSTTQAIKLTAWRGAYGSTAASTFVWDVAPSATVSFAQARLNTVAATAMNGATTATTKPGVELRDVHRGINKLGGVSAGIDPVTARYSWLLSTGRDKNSAHYSDPLCAALDCHVDGGVGITDVNTVFSGDESAVAANAVSANSATYLAEKYSMASGTTLECRWRNVNATNENWSAWEKATGATCPTKPQHVSESRTVIAVTPTVLAPRGTSTITDLLRDTTGTKIQFVVLEWWGTGTPPADLEVEVFVS